MTDTCPSKRATRIGLHYCLTEDLNDRIYWKQLVDARFSPNALCAASPSQQLVDLDAELLALQKATTRARRLRNRRAFPCRLPPEALILVFQHLQAIWPPTRRREDQTIVYQSGWFTVAHVCSLMREVSLTLAVDNGPTLNAAKVAFDSPTLWTTFANALDILPEHIPSILMRSRNLPFDLTLTCNEFIDGKAGPPPNSPWFSPSVCRRVRCLTLREFETTIEWPLPPNPHGPTLLQELTIAGKEPQNSAALQLPEPFHQLSQVRRLTLQHYHPPWNAAIFSHNLVYLKLGFSKDIRSSHLPAFEDFQTMLARSPALTYLFLENVHPLHIEHSAQILIPATLRLFKFRTEHIYMISAMRTISSLRLPRECAVLVNIFDVDRGSEETDEEDLEPQWQPALQDRCISNIFNGETDDDEPRLRELVLHSFSMSGTFTLQHLDVWLNPQRFLLDLHDVTWDDDSDDPILTSTTRFFYVSRCRLLNPLQLIALRHVLAISFCYHQTHPLRRHDLEYLANYATEVHQIGITLPARSSMDILHMLADFSSSDVDDTEHRPPLFPLLETLVVTHQAFEAPPKVSFVREFMALTSAVIARRQAGLPLKKIVASKSAAEWSVWDALEGAVEIAFL